MSMAKGTEIAKAADNVTETTTDTVPFKAFIAQNAEFNSNILTIATETTNYSKKYLDNSLAFVEKLLGAKSFDTVIQIQSEYAKTSFEDFVAQSKKIGELYSNLPKVAFKPVEEAIAKSQGTR
jgi:hypothetical protein